jgi:hypothetical protein
VHQENNKTHQANAKNAKKMVVQDNNKKEVDNFIGDASKNILQHQEHP